MTQLKRIEIPGASLTILCDGQVQLGAELFSNLPDDQATDLLQQAQSGPDPILTSVNAFLYQTQGRIVLVDAGGAGLFPGLGAISDQLTAAGIQPSQVDTIFCTHLHPDHIGGLLEADQPMFANATLWVHEDELAFWSDTDIQANAPEEGKAFFDAAQAVIAAYQHQLQPFTGAAEIAPDAIAVPLPGHTPGHCGLQIGNIDTGVFIWGDIVHVEAIQLPVPAASIAFDVDPQQAIATRNDVLEQVARAGTRVAGGHLSGSGVGYIRQVADGYAFEPE